MPDLKRAYSLVTVKGFDPATRSFSGIATSPVPDRLGDRIFKVKYKNPLPLLLYHNSRMPVGEARFKASSDQGTPFEAKISTIDRPGTVKDRLDEAADSLAASPPLIKGVSIGFNPLEPPVYNKETGGFDYPLVEVLELSMVVIPAHQDATIMSLKQFDRGLAALGNEPGDDPDDPAGASALSPRKRRARTMAKKTIGEKIAANRAERVTISERMAVLMKPVLDETGEMDAEQQKEYDELVDDLKVTDKAIAQLEAFERSQVMPTLRSVSTEDGGIVQPLRRVEIKEQKLPPGIEYTRMVICKAAGRLLGMSPLEIAKERYPDNPRIQTFLKAAVTGAQTTGTWGGQLVQDTITLPGEFLDYLRPMTIVGKFGTDGIPSLMRVPFLSRVQSATSGGSADWVGQGKQKPVTSFGFDAVSLGFSKIAAIAVLAEELIRFSTPSAETRVRDLLTKIIVERLDRDFIDPDKAASANISPASITNGLTGLTPSSGGDADDVRTDVATMIGSFITANQDVGNLVWIMSNSSALQLMLMRNALGQREFPDITVKGGSFEGFPVIASQYAALVGSPTPNVVILLNPAEILLADDGGVSVDMSNEATIEMSTDPENEVGTQVSMFQTNNVALRAERYINWARGRDSAVKWLDAAAWSAAA